MFLSRAFTFRAFTFLRYKFINHYLHTFSLTLALSHSIYKHTNTRTYAGQKLMWMPIELNIARSLYIILGEEERKSNAISKAYTKKYRHAPSIVHVFNTEHLNTVQLRVDSTLCVHCDIDQKVWFRSSVLIFCVWKKRYHKKLA